MPEATIADFEAVERLLDSMPKDKLRQLVTLPQVKAEKDKLWTPWPKQMEAVLNPADETFYGGEAGGGKSDLLMGLAVRYHTQSLLLRRTNKEASKFIKRLEEIIGHRNGWNGQLMTFALGKRVIECGGCQLEDDKQKYKGDPHDLIGFDEISDFTETQYRFIIGWNRSTDPSQRCRVVAAGNPPTRPEGLWVLKYWGAWLDPTHPNPAKPGELRWYTTIAGEDHEVDGPGPHIIPGEAKPVRAKSRTFIRAKLADNPSLERTDYDARLAALPDGLRQAYREGKFDVSMADDLWQVIPTAWIIAAEERWKPDGWKGLAMTAMALDPAGGGEDPATIALRYGGWYGQIVSAKGPETADGSAMAGLVLRYRKDACPIVVDAGGGYAGAVIERFKDNEVTYRRFNGAESTGEMARGSNLKFANKRAEVYWRFREELDPDQEGGSVIALPPDPVLRAELAAVRYSVEAKGIKLEDKDDVRERIGRSPNHADAVVMCFSEGTKAAIKRLRAGQRRPQVIVGYAKQKRR